MARSDAILKRLLALHPKIIDLSLDRMERILSVLGNPQNALPPVTNSLCGCISQKGSDSMNVRAPPSCVQAGSHAESG